MWKTELQAIIDQHLLRELSVIDSPASPIVDREGQKTLLMASNNYLGLADHPSLKHAAQAAIQKFGVGAGASRLLSGSQTPHHDLELALAQFTGTEAALTFSSGYATNLGVIPCLAKANGLILADRLCHASLLDGCRLSRATLRIFHHNDLEHLQQLLAKRPANRPTLIITEGVFSMDGDLAPLPDLVRLAEQYHATLLMDDAHGTGVMGPTGKGTIEHFGLDPGHILHMGTLSKALGTSGGFLAGSQDCITYLINTARSFIYSTAPPPAMAAAAQTALEMIQQDPERRARLWNNREHMHTGLTAMGYQLTPTQSPILPILLNDPQLAVDMSQRLQQQGVYIPAIRPPTVPKGTSRLRVTVTADHSLEQLNFALKALQRVGTSLKIL